MAEKLKKASPEAKGPAESKAVPTKIHYSEPLNVVYSNYASFLVSDRDVYLDFGIRQAEKVKLGSEPPVLISTRIIMSPQHAKMVAENLVSLIKNYEETFGKMHTPS